MNKPMAQTGNLAPQNHIMRSLEGVGQVVDLLADVVERRCNGPAKRLLLQNLLFRYLPALKIGQKLFRCLNDLCNPLLIRILQAICPPSEKMAL